MSDQRAGKIQYQNQATDAERRQKVESRAGDRVSRRRRALDQALQPGRLHEDGATSDRLSRGIELIAVEPDPAGARRRVVDPDDPELEWLVELYRCCPVDEDDLAGSEVAGLVVVSMVAEMVVVSVAAGMMVAGLVIGGLRSTGPVIVRRVSGQFRLLGRG